MKVVLTEALHARPASLLVRLAGAYEASVELRKGPRTASASNIMDVLGLAGCKGEELEVVATGADAERALEAIEELVRRSFDADLVPERGAAAVEGIAIGRALVVEILGGVFQEGAGSPAEAEEERARLREAAARVERDLEELVASLPADEARLFAPELEMTRALASGLGEELLAGEPAESAVVRATQGQATDLLLDLRTRLLGALAGEETTAIARALAAAAHDEALVLVTEQLPPSLVAAAPPRVVGIVAAIVEAEGHGVGQTSHAAILARGRGLPLAFVPQHVVAQIAHGEWLVADTTESPARVWVAPGAALLADARARLGALAARERATADAPDATAAEGAAASLPLAVRANVSSIRDEVPPLAEGIGLVRTELVFAGRRAAPTVDEQRAAVLAIAGKARGGPCVVRLFDAGGDKPVPWLPGDARGMELLFLNPEVLRAQLAAIGRARAHADVRVLLPLARSSDDVARVRSLVPHGLPVGAMIETPDAVLAADAIAEAADFLSIGTNDLTALALGAARADVLLALDPRVLALVRRTVEAAHARGRPVTVCGEVAGTDEGARALAALGVDALSVAPGRVGAVRRALAAAARENPR